MIGSDEPRHRRYGTSVSEWIAQGANELETDAVGFWQIVPDGREGFGLEGTELDAFVRRSLAALFSRGAVPVRHMPSSGVDWTWQRNFGSSSDEMVEAVLADWIARGRPDPDLGDLWFTTKDSLNQPPAHPEPQDG